MDGDSDSDVDVGEAGDHSGPMVGGADKERAMDAPFFVAAILITLVFVVVVFFLRG